MLVVLGFAASAAKQGQGRAAPFAQAATLQRMPANDASAKEYVKPRNCSALQIRMKVPETLPEVTIFTEPQHSTIAML